MFETLIYSLSPHGTARKTFFKTLAFFCWPGGLVSRASFWIFAITLFATGKLLCSQPEFFSLVTPFYQIFAFISIPMMIIKRLRDAGWDERLDVFSFTYTDYWRVPMHLC